MKKVLGFMRSMRFGMILLAVIAALSILGTLIPQQQTAEAYNTLYGQSSSVLYALGLDHLYSTWYYVGLYALLCLNLLLCSVLRFGKVRRAKSALLTAAEKGPALEGFSASDPEPILRGRGFRKDGSAWLRNGLGLYGSFITHLALLVMLIACACVFTLEVKADYNIPVGDQVTLEDGTALRVDSFAMESDGRVDYVSELSATLSDGTERQVTIRVNQPVHIGRYKVYQQSYNYVGQLDIRTEAEGEDERVTLDSPAFLTLDGTDGISYMGSFGTYVRTADGEVLPPGYDGAEGDEVDAYMIAILEGERQEVKLQPVDETLEVAGVYYTFRSPTAYPGLRVKTVPAWVMPLLYASFVLLLAGLYLCFFHVPVAADVRGSGVALASRKDMEELADALREAAEQGKEG